VGSLICFSESVIVCVFSAEKVRDPTPAPPLEGRGAATAREDVLGNCYIVAPKSPKAWDEKTALVFFQMALVFFQMALVFFQMAFVFEKIAVLFCWIL
jgi:hypothetical protein